MTNNHVVTVITIREFSRNLKCISERVLSGESFFVSRNAEVIFEIKPQQEREQLETQIEKKVAQIDSLKKELDELLEKIN